MLLISRIIIIFRCVKLIIEKAEYQQYEKQKRGERDVFSQEIG